MLAGRWGGLRRGAEGRERAVEKGSRGRFVAITEIVGGALCAV